MTKKRKITWDDIIIEDDDAKKSFSDSSFTIQKADPDKRLVFGWALVSATADGKKIIDHQGDIVEQEDLEEAAYEYVLNFRDAGEEHIGSLRKKARMVESVVFTEEKLQAMGIPAGNIPYGWWIGFYVDDDKAWELIKNGTYTMFSIEGKAVREPVDDPVQKSTSQEPRMNSAQSFMDIIEKFNPYHDRLGRFTTAGTATSFTYKPGQGKMYDNAIAREKERTAALGTGTKEDGFTAAKSKEEAVKYAKEKLNIPDADYGSLDIDTINHVNQEITAIYKKYPELNGAVSSIKKDNRERVYAAAGTGYSGRSSLYIGQKQYGKGIEHLKKHYQEDVDSGFHTKDTDYRSIIWHEFGHIYAYTMCKKSLGFDTSETLGYYDSQNYFKNVKGKKFEKQVVRDAAKSLKITQKELKSRISRYAEKNEAETFAEAFAEFNNSPNPRPECIAMMKAAGILK